VSDVGARRRLSLSFDNGPFAGVTPAVLEVLRQLELPATFFVCGKDAADPEKREILERVRDAGHAIGNHTLSHSVELGASRAPDAAAIEIGEAQEALGELAEPERLFRPYGAGGILGPRLLSPSAVEYLCEGGYSLVLWNSVPRDWDDPEGWPERALADIARHEWTLLVLHDIPTGAMKALPRFLERALAAGVEIVRELPPACVPIRRGEVALPLEGLVSRP
jgi:peptidoglycan/xylan/chitin deacetylase (PgdA/CDA1 family)